MPILVQDPMSRLVDVLAMRRANNQQPILFLGEGLARAAGIRSIEEMARELYPLITQQELESQPADPDEEQEKVLEAFYTYWETLSPIERKSMLQRYYSRAPVPAFYHDLVQLLAARYFVSILSTNYDTLLEQALDFHDLQSGKDYEVISLPEVGSESALATVNAQDTAVLRIVKLHGDVSQSVVAITPEEIVSLLSPQRMEVKTGFLSGEIVLVGYNFESEPISEWLTWTGGELWWVSPERPSQEQIGRIAQNHGTNFVEGSNGEPAEFFGLLRFGLMQLSGSDQLQFPDPAQPETIMPSDFGTTQAASLSVSFSSGEDVESQLLRQRLEQHRKRSRDLEAQVLYSVQSNPEVRVQIDYESAQIDEIERRLDSLARGEV